MAKLYLKPGSPKSRIRGIHVVGGNPNCIGVWLVWFHGRVSHASFNWHRHCKSIRKFERSLPSRNECIPNSCPLVESPRNQRTSHRKLEHSHRCPGLRKFSTSAHGSWKSWSVLPRHCWASQSPAPMSAFTTLLIRRVALTRDAILNLKRLA